MSAHTFKITLDERFDKTHEVIDTGVHDHTSGSKGEWKWDQEKGKTTWKFVSKDGIVGTCGGLRIKPRNGPDDIYHVVAFGYHNSKPWYGAVTDLTTLEETAHETLPKFYGSGKYNKRDVYWTQDPEDFKVTGRTSYDEISFIAYPDFQTGMINVRILVLKSW